MIPYERQQKILELLKDTDILKIEELQKHFPTISDSTLRRDLKELEKKRKIDYLSGGAIKAVSTTGEIPISQRNTLHSQEKDILAELAAQFVQAGDVIYLDSGSSCTSLFRRIMSKRITVYTTNTDIFSVITEENQAEIIVLGGQFNALISSISGPLTEENLKNIYFTKSFLGVNGIDEKYGVTTPTLVEANKKRLVKEHSDHVYLLSDSSKFHNLSNVKAFDLKDVTVISDRYDEKLGKVVSLICPES
ncbi:DeoR/GlpR family DNA-binding transcription regulator [Streptococcus merionis]|nr:DeoR/GlpR family DNA-binding transcription regulator [Streptococcus merionis]